MIYTCYHNPKFTNYALSAISLSDCAPAVVVDVPDTLVNEEALEFVFRHTNTVNRYFWEEYPTIVKLLGGVKGTRSLSSGDLVQAPDGQVWLCDSFGFTPLSEHNEGLPIKQARFDCLLEKEYRRTHYKPNYSDVRPTKDPRWIPVVISFGKEILGDYTKDFVGGECTRDGYVRLNAPLNRRNRLQKYGIVHWPSTGKFWVFEMIRKNDQKITFGVGKILFVDSDYAAVEAKYDALVVDAEI